MKLYDNMPIFFKVSVNQKEIPATRARGAADNFYLTIIGFGVTNLKPGQNIM